MGDIFDHSELWSVADAVMCSAAHQGWDTNPSASRVLAADVSQSIAALGIDLPEESHLIPSRDSLHPLQGLPPPQGQTTLQGHPSSRELSGSAEASVAYLFFHLPDPAPVTAPRLLIPVCPPVNFLHSDLYLGLLPGGAELKT